MIWQIYQFLGILSAVKCTSQIGAALDMLFNTVGKIEALDPFQK